MSNPRKLERKLSRPALSLEDRAIPIAEYIGPATPAPPKHNAVPTLEVSTMSNPDSITSESEVSEWMAFYANLPNSAKASSALEILKEIVHRDAQLYALCSAIINNLKPSPGGNYPDINSLILSELMEEELGDSQLHNNLEWCIQTMAADCQAGLSTTKSNLIDEANWAIIKQHYLIVGQVLNGLRETSTHSQIETEEIDAAQSVFSDLWEILKESVKQN